MCQKLRPGAWLLGGRSDLDHRPGTHLRTASLIDLHFHAVGVDQKPMASAGFSSTGNIAWVGDFRPRPSRDLSTALHCPPGGGPSVAVTKLSTCRAVIAAGVQIEHVKPPSAENTRAGVLSSISSGCSAIVTCCRSGHRHASVETTSGAIYSGARLANARH